MPGHGNVRLERFREHADDCREFYNIDCEVQIQSLIVLISAYEKPINIDRMEGRIGEISRTQRGPDKHTIHGRANYTLNRFYNGNLDPICVPQLKVSPFNQKLATHYHHAPGWKHREI
jgi:hypothetical protein